ncbi:hypothetical protein QG044_09535 [Kingella kingae]|uniref:hypothetical protein n=1 Tax=Kingella kingae TaxID=504 RepID=UPI00056F4806|nr:hypothetical protein [Kingella kingae]MDK4577460.1 hypothetical protein [Kingella kingae]MDK4583466.1 hypothetical protein [Kingella kingae]MDK4593652.1 hypothetical protein [Kingella kingae]MDK4595644.1 hypothetical protein [Kingella kingae]MDK4605380.1 hypothetical protein [Kingella kingae]
MKTYCLGATMGLMLALMTWSAMQLAVAHTLSDEPVAWVNRVQVVDCDNIKHSDLSAWQRDDVSRYALARVQAACDANEQAMAMMQLWEKAPSAGVVLEP